MTDAAASAPRRVLPRVLASWWAPGRVAAGLRGMSEGAMTALLLAAMVGFLLAQVPVHARAAALDPSVPLGARIAGAALSVVFLMPLLAYGVAGLAALLARAMGRRLVPADSRLALFWALLAVAPAMMLAGAVEWLAGPSLALTAARCLAGAGFVLIWAGGLRALGGRA